MTRDHLIRLLAGYLARTRGYTREEAIDYLVRLTPEVRMAMYRRRYRDVGAAGARVRWAKHRRQKRQQSTGG